MATHPQSSLAERPELRVVNGGRNSKKRAPTSTKARLITTFLALVALGVVLRFLPATPRKAQANTNHVSIQAAPPDLEASSVQMSQSVGGEALYLDGRVSNYGKARITSATVEVTFADAQGRPIATIQKPLAGVAKGGVGAVPGEFAQNPIGPNETRFFRIAVEQVPADWNHEVPQLKIVAVKGK